MNKNHTFARALALLLILLCLTPVMALAEEAAAPTADPLATQAPAAAETATQDENEINYDINVMEALTGIAQSTGFANATWQEYVMIAIACVLLYLAIVKQFEPLLLLPIAFGMLLANLPLAGMMGNPVYTEYALTDYQAALKMAALKSKEVIAGVNAAGEMVYRVETSNGGLLYYLYQGVKLGIYPPLIFMGVGAMTDFAPLIANPKSLLMGAGAQFGIFFAFTVAILLGFDARGASAIGIIGGADGPTAIFVTTKLAPHLLGPIAVAAYSYMALVPVIQPPIMRLLTTKKERLIRMDTLRPVSKTETIIFPIVVTLLVSFLLPDAAPLIGMLMLGNLMRVTGVVDRISKTAQNELMNIVTIFLGVTVGATANGSTFLDGDTIKVIVIGVFAFGFGTVGGVVVAKIMNWFTGGKINPLIGSAGVSAVPMAARVSQVVGQKEDPGNFLLMHAMGPNVAGVIGSAVAAGVFLQLFG